MTAFRVGERIHDEGIGEDVTVIKPLYESSQRVVWVKLDSGEINVGVRDEFYRIAELPNG